MDSSSDIMNMEEGANNLFSPRVPVDYSKVRNIATMTISQSPKLWHHEAI